MLLRQLSYVIKNQHKAFLVFRCFFYGLKIGACTKMTFIGLPDTIKPGYISIQGCCSICAKTFFFRCFELNEFSGVNFVASPCRFLKTLEKTLTDVEPTLEERVTVEKHSDQVDSSALEPSDQMDIEPDDVQMVEQCIPQKTQDSAMSNFQSAVQNCCSSSSSNTAYR